LQAWIVTEPPAVQLTPPEEQLLALIREGRVDAEIAVRLGITNRDVKERIERLAAKLGVRDRAELRDEAGEAEPGPLWLDERVRPLPSQPRWPLAVAGLAGLLIGAGAMWLAMRGPADSGTGPPSSEEVFPSVTVRLGGPLPNPTATARSTTIAGRTMLDAGQLFLINEHVGGVTSEDTREDLIVITLDDAGVFRFDGGAMKWTLFGSSRKSLGLAGDLNGETVTLTFSAVGETWFLFGGDDSVGVYASDGSEPRVAAWVSAPDSLSRRYHVEVGFDGHLYISARPLSLDLPVAFDTGETFDVSGLTYPYVATIASGGDHLTFCERDRLVACQAFVANMDRAPATGRVSCSPDGVLELEGEAFTLRFEDPEGPGCVAMPSRSVVVGQNFSFSAGVVITAVAPDGSPLSVVVSHNGTLFIGRFAPTYGCPCRTGT
jgi:DNA-binding CsgD family transcriptional regulator